MRFGCGLSLAEVYGIALARGSAMGGFDSKWQGRGVAGCFGPRRPQMGGFARDGIAWRPTRGLVVVAIILMGFLVVVAKGFGCDAGCVCGVLEGRVM